MFRPHHRLSEKPSSQSEDNQSQKTAFLSNTTSTKSSLSKSGAFNASGFTQSDDNQPRNLTAAPLEGKSQRNCYFVSSAIADAKFQCEAVR